MNIVRTTLALVVASACAACTSSVEPKGRGPADASPIASTARAPASDSRARLAALRAPYAWIADLHHEAMQAALQDPRSRSFTGRGAGSSACAEQIRYMERYAPRVAAAAHDGRYDDARALRALALQVGKCRDTVVDDSSSSSSTPFARYARSLSAALRSVRTLPNALAAIDASLLAAADDPTVGPEDLAKLAALTTVAVSSANEWSALAPLQSHDAHGLASTMSLGGWFSGTISADVDGCKSGADAGVTGCALGGIGGSVMSWF